MELNFCVILAFHSSGKGDSPKSRVMEPLVFEHSVHGIASGGSFVTVCVGLERERGTESSAMIFFDGTVMS